MIKRSPKSVFLLLCAVSVVAAWQPLRDALWLATHDDEYTHLLLILPAVAALIWLKLSGSERRSEEAMVAPCLRAGLILLCTSLLVVGFARRRVDLAQDERLTADILALVTWWIGSFVLCFGARLSRFLLFPLGFLFLLVPLPRFLVNGIVDWLAQASALTAHGMFFAARVPVTQNGVFLDIPGLTVEVAKECSSIRSSSMLLVTTMILAQLLLRTTWRKWLMIALAIPVSVAKNGLRIFTIAMLGTRVDPSYLTGKLHHQGGIVFFSIGLGCMFFVLWILHRNERSHFSPMDHAG
ncbi:MAG: exosortase/archaeosortase family protein [Candidatus Sulfotelmatobacter sp.]